jgi:hypothetical protein
MPASDLACPHQAVLPSVVEPDRNAETGGSQRGRHNSFAGTSTARLMARCARGLPGQSYRRPHPAGCLVGFLLPPLRTALTASAIARLVIVAGGGGSFPGRTECRLVDRTFLPGDAASRADSRTRRAHRRSASAKTRSRCASTCGDPAPDSAERGGARTRQARPQPLLFAQAAGELIARQPAIEIHAGDSGK